jgi:hypothetical protein
MAMQAPFIAALAFATVFSARTAAAAAITTSL